MSMRGADFSELQPKDSRGVLDLSFTQLTESADLDAGEILQVTPNNAFRLGQQVYFWLGIQNPIATIEGVQASDNWVTRIRLKLWWARPTQEFRQPGGGGGQLGATGWTNLDTRIYGEGPNADPLLDNRYVWTPSPKRLDVTPYDTAPPPLPPARHSDSVLLDDCWVLDLYDPSDAAIQAKFAAPQLVTRWEPILYPAFGYALGFTAQWDTEAVPDPGVIATPTVSFNLTWSQGTFGGGGRISESIG